MPSAHCQLSLARAHEPSEHTAPAGQVMHVKSASFVLYIRLEHTHSSMLVDAVLAVVDAAGQLRQLLNSVAPDIVR